MTTGNPGGRPRWPESRWSVFEDEHDARPRGRGDQDEPAAGGEAAEPLDPLLTAVARELRRPVALDPALDDRIMAAVAREELPSLATADLTAEHAVVAADGRAVRAWRWLRRPRTVRVSPLGGLASLAGLAAAAALVLMVGRTSGEGGVRSAETAPRVATIPHSSLPTPSSAPDTIQVVQFVLVAPGARSVALVGDFNDWEVGATPLRAASSGRLWSVEVPLTPGRHRYAFVVDDETWLADPTAPRAPGADFGTPSSVVTVVERRS